MNYSQVETNTSGEFRKEENAISCKPLGILFTCLIPILSVLVFSGCSNLKALRPVIESASQTSLTTSGTISFGTAMVENMVILRNSVGSTDGQVIMLSGYKTAGDSGGGSFVWLNASSCVDDNGACIQPANYSGPGRWIRQISGGISPKWFGARGDDTGKSPADEGVSIQTALWNRWPTWSLPTMDAYGKSVVDYTPTEAGFVQNGRPFRDSDSWDSIGIMLALWKIGQGQGELYVPAGTYQLTMPILYTNQMRTTLRGAGIYQTILTKKANNFNNSAAIILHRVAGIPTVVRDLAVRGPIGGGMTNFTAIRQSNTNGVHLENLYIIVANLGVDINTLGSDNFISGVTTEYGETSIKVDEKSDVTISNSNFWQTQPAAYRYTAINNRGRVNVYNTKFIGYGNAGIVSGDPTAAANGPVATDNSRLTVSGCDFQTALSVSYSHIKAYGSVSNITNNTFEGATSDISLYVGSNSVVTGNTFHQTAGHAILNLLYRSSGTIVQGNKFLAVLPLAQIAEGGLILSMIPGVSYSAGSSNGTIVGNSMSYPGSINLSSNAGHVIANNGSGI